MAKPQPLAICARKGYTIVARQAREGFGELDLVAVDRGVVVFVEVKTRQSDSAGHPAEAVDLNKQRRLTRAALAFLRRHHLLDHPVRFDVVAIRWPANVRRPVIEHILHAFEPPGRASSSPDPLARGWTPPATVCEFPSLST